jgi:hypothetical protein
MSDYSIITDFAAKDALLTGNPLKLVKGTEYTAEFTAIETAIASKFDSDDIASEAEAEAGASNSKLITPATLAHVLEEFDPSVDYETGTYTASFAGFGTPPTTTIRYTRIGTIVVLHISRFSGTSDANTFTETSGNMPVAIRPARMQGCAAFGLDSGSGVGCFFSIATTGNLTMRKDTGNGNWAVDGTKGLGDGSRDLTITYSMD